MTRAGALALSVLAAGACQTTTPAGERVPGPYGDLEWVRSETLRIGEREFFDDGLLQVALLDVGIDDAIVSVRTDGVTRRARIRTGPAGGVLVTHYQVRLVSTTISDTATIEVSRLR